MTQEFSDSSLGSSGAPTAAALFPVGRVLAGRYRIVRFLGAGGMGWVVEAADEELGGQHVALKLLYPHLLEHETSRSRFKNEVLIARRLSHPNIVRTYSFMTDRDRDSFITMELVDGPTLSEKIRASEGGGLPVESALRYFIQILSALRFAHEHGIIHRDLKPENVLIAADGRAKVADFGLAQALRQEHRFTRVGELLGTPFYMSPEQFRGEQLTFSSDIYSLGIILYEMLCGRPPYTDTCIYKLGRAHCKDPLPPFPHPIPEWLRHVLAGCTEKQPEKRYQSVEELVHALSEHAAPYLEELYQQGGSLIEPPAAPPRVVRQINVLAFLSMGVILGLCVFVMFCRGNDSVNWRVAAVLLMAERETSLRFDLLKRLLAIRVTLDRPEDLFSFDPSIVRPLLVAGLNPDTVQDGSGNYPIHFYAKHDTFSTGMIVHLIEHGGRLDLRNRDGDTPLLLASRQNSYLVGTVLLKYDKSTINAVDNTGSTALHYTAYYQDSAFTKLLLAHGADPGARNGLQETPLHFAARSFSRNLEAVDYLLQFGADVNAQNAEGQIPLMLVLLRDNGVAADQLAVASRLLEAGSDTRLKDQYGNTVRMIAEQQGNQAFLSLLERFESK